MSKNIEHLIADDDFMPVGGKAYGIGGINAHNFDTTRITNIPIHPDDGEPMYCKWVYPSQLHRYLGAGYKPIPKDAFEEGFRGADGMNPMFCASPTAKWDEGQGFMMCDGKELVAIWTRPRTRRLEIEHEEGIIFHRKYGTTRAPGVGTDVVPDGEYHMVTRGVAGFEEAEIEREVTSRAGIKRTEKKAVRSPQDLGNDD